MEQIKIDKSHETLSINNNNKYLATSPENKNCPQDGSAYPASQLQFSRHFSVSKTEIEIRKFESSYLVKFLQRIVINQSGH